MPASTAQGNVRNALYAPQIPDGEDEVSGVSKRLSTECHRRSGGPRLRNGAQRGHGHDRLVDVEAPRLVQEAYLAHRY